VERPHLIDFPIFWVGVQLVELFVVIPVLLFWVPETWPIGVRVAIWAAAVIGVFVANYVVIRRLRAPEDTPSTGLR
jgi:hypothetical protein